MLRNLLVFLAFLISSTQALVLHAASAVGTRLSVATASRPGGGTCGGNCVCMACRNNLKKEKRLRNRVNAFRFKKNTFTRFRRFDDRQSPADLAKAEEDAKHMSLVQLTRLLRPAVPKPRYLCPVPCTLLPLTVADFLLLRRGRGRRSRLGRRRGQGIQAQGADAGACRRVRMRAQTRRPNLLGGFA